MRGPCRRALHNSAVECYGSKRYRNWERTLLKAAQSQSRQSSPFPRRENPRHKALVPIAGAVRARHPQRVPRLRPARAPSGPTWSLRCIPTPVTKTRGNSAGSQSAPEPQPHCGTARYWADRYHGCPTWPSACVRATAPALDGTAAAAPSAAGERRGGRRAVCTRLWPVCAFLTHTPLAPRLRLPDTHPSGASAVALEHCGERSEEQAARHLAGGRVRGLRGPLRTSQADCFCKNRFARTSYRFSPPWLACCSLERALTAESTAIHHGVNE